MIHGQQAAMGGQMNAMGMTGGMLGMTPAPGMFPPQAPGQMMFSPQRPPMANPKGGGQNHLYKILPMITFKVGERSTIG